MSEIWKDILGYEGIYQISNLGRCKKLYREWFGGNGGKRFTEEKIMTPHYSKFGYNHQPFIKNGKLKDLRICRLVAIAFIPNPENKPFVNHKDGNKANDNAGNLEWNTRSENDMHAFKNGLRSAMTGSKNGMSKITEGTVIEIRKLAHSGENSMNIAEKYNLRIEHVKDIIKRRSWRHI